MSPSEPEPLSPCRLGMRLVRTVFVGRSTRHKTWLVTGLLIMTASGCGSNPSAVSTKASDGVLVLPCQDIGAKLAPPSDFSIVFDRVAVPTARALQANRSVESDPARRWFAKTGLFVRRGASFDLVVPDEWRGRLTLGWGGKKGSHLRVPACRPTGTTPQASNPESEVWLVYAGGYWVPETACVSVVVRVAQAEQTVRIGVGASCPGQGPPPQPAD
jgi:hypothetical protein